MKLRDEKVSIFLKSKASDCSANTVSSQADGSSDGGGLELTDDRKWAELLVYVALPAACILLVALMAAAACRRRRSSAGGSPCWWCCCCPRSKLRLADIIALDLQNAESSADFLSSLTRNAERHTSTSSDGSDGVFVMVYLPPPYEETLTKITRAASLSSSSTRDAESVRIEDLEAKLCPEIRSSGRFV